MILPDRCPCRRLLATVSAVRIRELGSAVLLLAACTGSGGGSDGATPEFCQAYDAFVEANRDGEGLEELRQVLELAPSGTERFLEPMLELYEQTSAVADAGGEGDVTGDMGAMQAIARMREPAAREDEQRLRAIVRDDCDRAHPADAEQPTITPFTSIAPLED